MSRTLRNASASLMMILLLATVSAGDAMEKWIYRPVLKASGSETDVACFSAIVRHCDDSKNTVRTQLYAAMGSINEETAEQLPIRLLVDRGNKTDNLFADYGTALSTRRLHIDHFEQMFGFSCPTPAEGNEDSRPSWAPTLCSVFGHEIAETMHVFVTQATDECARWRSHLVGTAAENVLRGANQTKNLACRSVEPDGVAVFLHGKHEDTFLQYGTNYVIIHFENGISSVDYVTGGDDTCLPRQWHRPTLEQEIVYPSDHAVCAE